MATTQADLDQSKEQFNAANAELDAKPDTQESVGFWERLKAGNIDDESSEAYKRWNPKAKAARDAAVASLKSGADKAAESGIAAGKAADAEPVMTAAPNDVKVAHEEARTQEAEDFSKRWKELSESVTAAPGELAKEPDVVAVPAAAKPAVRKPVAKPVAKAPAVDPVASTLKAAPVAKPAWNEGMKADAQDSMARDQASKIKMPAAQPATLKQKFAADNANIKGVMIDGQPAMRPGSEAAPVREPFSKKIGTVRMAGE